MRHFMDEGRRGSALWGKGGRGELRGRAILGAFALVAVLAWAPSAFAGGPSVTVALPDTTIVTGPADGGWVTGRSASFAFASTAKQVSYECSVDGGAFAACSSSPTFALGFDAHTLAVRAVDRQGNADPTPATVSWKQAAWVSTAVYKPGSLLARAQAAPFDSFKVIVETQSRGLKRALVNFSNENGKLKREFTSIAGVSAKLPGWALLAINENQATFGPTTITEDVQVKMASTSYAPVQLWQKAVHADRLWSHDAVLCALNVLTGLQVDPSCTPDAGYAAPAAPAIAVVDSGIQPDRAADFGTRVVASVAMSSLSPGRSDDGRGHGTFVASIAAGSSSSYPGAADNAPIVSIRVMDDSGKANTSDVIAAADWILANKDQYNIRVANFSLHSANAGSFKFDPLDHAVERLWFSGVTVVAASGNFGDGTRQHMAYAPGNDPFVITVGAADVNGTAGTADDSVAPWSAYGYTLDGFAKPEVVAPGRYMIGAVPPTATLTAERPDHVVAPGYMQLSGTSFAAPVVAGAAAKLLAEHPGWTPDHVKGALMATAHPLAVSDRVSDGFGEIDEYAADNLGGNPNPNLGLSRFVVADSTTPGGYAFDTVSWESAARADVSWESVSWTDVSWESVSWTDVSWTDVSWESVSWESVSWTDAAAEDAALSDVSWTDVSWTDSSAKD